MPQLEVLKSMVAPGLTPPPPSLNTPLPLPQLDETYATFPREALSEVD